LAHFFRHVKGRSHIGHVFVGRCGFLCVNLKLLFNKNNKKLNKNESGGVKAAKQSSLPIKMLIFIALIRIKPIGHLWHRLQKT